MTDTSGNSRERGPPPEPDTEAGLGELRAWFVREVLPLEADLVRFLRRHSRGGWDVNDLRQEVYLRAYERAVEGIPKSTRPFVFAIARNMLVDRYRREKIFPIGGVPDFDLETIPSGEPGPDRNAIARDELRRLYSVLDRLPPRCREAFVMRRVDQLPRREIAKRMGIAEKTVKRHLNDGLRLFIAMLTSDEAGDAASNEEGRQKDS